jgi:subtilase family serine protease
MSRHFLPIVFIASAALLFPAYSFGQDSQGAHPRGRILIPASSIIHPEDAAHRASTNIELFIPAGGIAGSSSPQGETPSSLACVYGLVTPIVPGCPIDATSVNPSGGWGAIGIVDAYDDPNIEADFAVFNTQFGLPGCTTDNGCFTKGYASGTKPRLNADWALEISLDVEWAHAMAPGAKIILIEAATSSFTDLLQAEDVAGEMVSAAGGGEISNSFAASEETYERSGDSHFLVPGIVYFAASGDSPYPYWPSISPHVAAAGGTTINRDAQGNAVSETGWMESGGGPSVYEPRPDYQDGIENIVGASRGTPDFSFDADPASGVSIYDSIPFEQMNGWRIVGGTSVASPSLAGIVNAAARKAPSTKDELTAVYKIYASRFYSAAFRDITVGQSGQHSCTVGWDFVTGMGSAVTYRGK